MRWGGGDVRGRSNELLIRSTGRRRQVRSGYMGGEEQLEARKCLTEKGTSMGNIKSLHAFLLLSSATQERNLWRLHKICCPFFALEANMFFAKYKTPGPVLMIWSV